MSLFPNTGLEARIRRAAESLLDSESVTADLNDDEARRLLEWGIGHARRLAMAEREALEDDLGALRKLMRGINKLAAEGRPVEAQRLRNRLERLSERAGALGFAPPELGAFDAYIGEQSRLAAGEKLERLLALFEID